MAHPHEPDGWIGARLLRKEDGRHLAGAAQFVAEGGRAELLLADRASAWNARKDRSSGRGDRSRSLSFRFFLPQGPLRVGGHAGHMVRPGHGSSVGYAAQGRAI